MASNLARKCCPSNEVFELAFPRTGDARGSISGGVLLGGSADQSGHSRTFRSRLRSDDALGAARQPPAMGCVSMLTAALEKSAAGIAVVQSSARRMLRYSHFITTPGWIWKPRGAAPENLASVYSEAFWPLIQQVKVLPLA